MCCSCMQVWQRLTVCADQMGGLFVDSLCYCVGKEGSCAPHTCSAPLTNTMVLLWCVCAQSYERETESAFGAGLGLQWAMQQQLNCQLFTRHAGQLPDYSF